MSVRNKPLSTVGRAFFSQGFPSVCGQINCEEVLTHFKIWGNQGMVVVKNGSHARMRKDAGSWLHPAPSPMFTGCGLIWRLEGMVFVLTTSLSMPIHKIDGVASQPTPI